MTRNLLTKAADWRHEREWRIIDYSGGSGLRDYPPDLLVEVILGARITEKDRADVLSWVDAHQPRPRVLQARLKERDYGLELEPV